MMRGTPIPAVPNIGLQTFPNELKVIEPATCFKICLGLVSTCICGQPLMPASPHAVVQPAFTSSLELILTQDQVAVLVLTMFLGPLAGVKECIRDAPVPLKVLEADLHLSLALRLCQLTARHPSGPHGHNESCRGSHGLN